MHLLGLGSSGKAIMRDSILGSPVPLHGGNLDMLALDAVLQRDAADWPLALRRTCFLLGDRGAARGSSSSTFLLELARKQLIRIVATVCEVSGSR